MKWKTAKRRITQTTPRYFPGTNNNNPYN